MIEIDQEYSEEFSFTQEQVAIFADVTGDTNPLHLDETYASATPFKRPIMHGMLGAGVISKVFGIKFPGKGTVYLSQQLEFKRPMFVDTVYVVTVKVKSVNRDKHTAVFSTQIADKTTGKICTDGEAQLMNKEQI